MLMYLEMVMRLSVGAGCRLSLIQLYQRVRGVAPQEAHTNRFMNRDGLVTVQDGRSMIQSGVGQVHLVGPNGARGSDEGATGVHRGPLHVKEAHGQNAVVAASLASTFARNAGSLP